ncbi:replication initiation protein, partial [bacterium]|nr:replication initiation protein [bacterium]
MYKRNLNEKNLVVKSNALIESKSSLTATEQKIVLCLISMISPEDEDFCKYILKISDFMDIAGIKDKSSYRRIQNATETLMKKILKIKQPNSILFVAWLSSVKYLTGEGLVELEFSPELKPYLLNLKSHFTQYQLANVMKLKSFYSIRIYELLKQYESFNVRTFEIKELREWLGIAENKYKKYNDFKKKVLLVATNEITQKTDLVTSFEEIKLQRKITRIKFTFHRERNIKAINLSEKTFKIPYSILKVLPLEYRINSIYSLIDPYLNDLDFLISNIEYANKNCTKNYLAYLKLALKEDYAKVNREAKEKKDQIVQEKKGQIQEKKDQEKLLKQKAWDYFNS